jgi:replicative DNA helicase
LQSGAGLGCVFIDYLQLLRPAMSMRNQNRNEELSEICRVLKATAKELNVPIIALAQLNRGVEARQDKRPMLSDLRDCLAGDALVTNADTGERVPMVDIAEKKLRFNVWAVDDRLKLVRRPIADAWLVGSKSVYRVTTQSGRTIRCSDGHRFLTVSGWARLRDLAPGRSVAVPRRYEAPYECESEFTPARAQLLGWLVGDGHFGGTPTLTVARIPEADLAVSLGASEFDVRPYVKPEHPRTQAKRVLFTTGRLCGAGKNPLTSWLRRLGVWKLTGAQKHVPASMFGQSDSVVEAFLRGLFHADGSLTRGATSSRVTVRLTTISETLARDVQHLLLRLGINAILKKDERNIGGFRTETKRLWTLALMERGAVCAFMDRIGFLGKKHAEALSKISREKSNDAGQFDRIPLEINERVTKLRNERGFSHERLGWREQGKAMSRTTCAMLAERLADEVLEALAFSDVVWDTIVAIEPDGIENVYDLTVGELHNFCVDGIVTHNSGAIEQEADLVTFLYRDAYYHPESAAEPDVTEFIIAKHRNGPTGMVKLRFLEKYTLFVPHGESSHYSAP